MDTDIIGYVGTGFLTITMVPQVYKTFRHGQAGGLSMGYLILQLISNGLFIAYGYFLHSLPVIIGNCVVAGCSLSLVYAKLSFKGEYLPI